MELDKKDLSQVLRLTVHRVYGGESGDFQVRVNQCMLTHTLSRIKDSEQCGTAGSAAVLTCYAVRSYLPIFATALLPAAGSCVIR